MGKFLIKQNLDDCIGCGTCESLCDNWKTQDDGKAVPKKTKLDEVGCNQKAADSCPTQCIEIIEEK